jgi:hypothetical protein
MAELFDLKPHRYALHDLKSDHQFKGSRIHATTGYVYPQGGQGRINSPNGPGYDRYYRLEQALDQELDQEPDHNIRPYQCLQLSLIDVLRADVDRLPVMSSIAQRVIRENILLIRQAGYAFKLRLRLGQRYLQSESEICISMRLTDDAAMSSVSLGKKDRVSSYVQRGLIDGEIQSKAHFRINNRPMLNKVSAVHDSGHLPDGEWQVDVLFAHWVDESTGEWVTLLNNEDMDLMQTAEIMFYPESRYRDFRITDLFATPDGAA